MTSKHKYCRSKITLPENSTSDTNGSNNSWWILNVNPIRSDMKLECQANHFSWEKWRNREKKTHLVMLFLTTAPSPSFSRSADIFLMTWRNDMLMILMMVKTMLMYISYVSLCSSKINNNKNVNVYILCLSLSSIRL